MHTRVTTIFVFSLLLASCKKADIELMPAATGSRTEFSLDSLYLYARETYLWYNLLPSYAEFNPRQYVQPGNDFNSLNEALKAITQWAVNPQTEKSYEYRNGYNNPLYSYIAEGNVATGLQAKAAVDGDRSDLGLGLAIINENAVYIRYVEDGSPAALAGLLRGMQVTHVNNNPVSPNPESLNGLINAPEVTMKLVTGNSDPITVNLKAREYEPLSVFKQAIFGTSAERTGYIALARFGNLSSHKTSLDVAFSRFSAQQVTNIIVDLRYNGGGYVETAQYIANLIAPNTVTGAVMYSEHFNDLLQQGNAPILKTIPYLNENKQPVYVNGEKATYADVDFSVPGNTYFFEKKGTLNEIKNVVFIVSNGTASASELLITSLKPYLNVKLVGNNTYGKPVGFFGIGIDRYTAYLSQFQIRNAAGEGNYYDGMQADINAVDDVTKDFGDSSENCLWKALTYLGYTFSGRQQKSPVLKVKPVANARSFNGMIENRLSLR